MQLNLPRCQDSAFPFGDLHEVPVCPFLHRREERVQKSIILFIGYAVNKAAKDKSGYAIADESQLCSSLASFRTSAHHVEQTGYLFTQIYKANSFSVSIQSLGFNIITY